MPITKKSWLKGGAIVVFLAALMLIGDCSSKSERDAIVKAATDKYAAMVGLPISAVSISSMKCSNGDSGKWREAKICVRSGGTFHEFLVKIGAPTKTSPTETTVSGGKALVCVGFL